MSSRDRFYDLMQQIQREYDAVVRERDAYRDALTDRLDSEAPTLAPPPPVESAMFSRLPAVPPPPLAPRVEVAVCGCGCSYTDVEFRALPAAATYPTLRGGVEVRECWCGSHVAVIREVAA